MIQFKALGGITLHGPQGPADRLLAQPRRLALLSWLAFAIPRGPHRRDRLVALFWPEAEEARARNSLSQAVYHLRHELEPGLVVGRNAETVGLDFTHLDCDVIAFEQAVAAGRFDLVRAAYQGELLPSFHVSGVPEFERWLERERQRLAGMATEAGWHAATEAVRLGETARAAEAARWAAGLVPYDEEALRRLLGVLDRAGDRAGAVDAFEEFAQRLGQEFGERPAPETAALVQHMRARRAPIDETAPDAGGVEAREAGSERGESAPEAAARPSRPGRRRRAGVLATVGLLAVAILFTLLARRSARADALHAPRAVAIMPFATHGEPTLAYLGDGVEALLEAKFDGVGGMRLVDPGAVRALLRPRLADEEEPPAELDAARRLHATHYVTGDVTLVGDRVQVRATLRSATPAEGVITTASAEGRRDSLFALTDALALRLLADAAGLGRREVQAARTEVTASLDAFRAFLDGEAAMAGGRYAEAAERFGRAVQLDSGFALAAYRGAVALDWAGHADDDMLAMLSLAERGHARLSERQRRLVAAAVAYYRQDGDSAERVLRGIVADDPDAIDAWFLLGETLFHLGSARGRDWREARVPFERVASLDPGDPEALLHLARIAAADGDHARLQATIDAGLPGLRGTVRGWELEALGAYASGDPALIARFRRGLVTAPPGAAQEAARALAVYLGEVDLAAEIDAQGQFARPSSLQSQLAAAGGRWHTVLANATVGECTRPDAPMCPELRLALASLPGVPLGPERAAALRGGVESASIAPASAAHYHLIVRQLALGRFAAAVGDRGRWAAARDSLVALIVTEPWRRSYVTWLDGVWLARQGGSTTPGDSLRALLREPAHRRELFGPDVAWPARLDVAMAFSASGHDEEALPIFRSVPDPSGRDLMFLPYARLGEARILARRGEVDAARKLYGQVLRLWAHADADFAPTVAAARTDSARLGH